MADTPEDHQHAGGADGSSVSQLARPGRVFAARSRSNKLTFETESAWQRDKDLEPQVAGHSTKDLKGKALLTLSFAALGVIYGDVGTSPLYVLQTVFLDPPRDPEDVVGVVSLIFWTITLLALVKYVLLVLSANDNGEGGTFAMYSLLCRAIGIGPYGQQQPIDTAVLNYDGSTFTKLHLGQCGIRHPAGAWLRSYMQRSKWAQVTLLVLVIIAAAMLMGDGTLTPSISVLSAVSGLQLASPSITQPVIVGVTIAILVLLFGLQRFGTHRVSSVFAPVILIWFLFNAAIGLYNLSTNGWGVWKAVSPSYAIQQFTYNFNTGWLRLGGVVLCVTGTEALFADLGHFSRPAVSWSFFCVVYPSLIITYFGQGSYLMTHPQAHDNPFWHSVPSPVFWPMLIVATFATIVASQALISGAFSLMRQAMMLGVFPRLTVMHTSEHVAGQVYIEEVNFLLMVGCIAVVAGFRDTVALGNAYGVAVVTVMLCTTVLFAIIMLVVWSLHPVLVTLFFLFFGLIEGLFLSSNYTKVPTGGWVALLIGAFVAAFTLIYWYGARKKSQYTRSRMVPVGELFVLHPSSGNGGGACAPLTAATAADTASADQQGAGGHLTATCGHVLSIGQHCVVLPQLRLTTTGQLLGRMPGLGIVYSDTVAGVPLVLQHLLHNIPMVFEITVFLTLRFIPIPYVSSKERFLVRISRSLPGFYHVVARYGYMDVVDHCEAFIKDMVTSVAAYMQHAEMQQAAPEQLPPDSPMHHTIDMHPPNQLGKRQGPLSAAADSPAAPAPELLTWASMDVSRAASDLFDMEPEDAVTAARRMHLGAASMPVVRREGPSPREQIDLRRLSHVPERRVRMALVNLAPLTLSPNGSAPAGVAVDGNGSTRTGSGWAADGSTSSGASAAPLAVTAVASNGVASNGDSVAGGAVPAQQPPRASLSPSVFATSAANAYEALESPGPGQAAEGRAPSSKAGATRPRTLSKPQQDLLLLLDAYKRNRVYLIGSSKVRCAPGSNIVKRVLIVLYRFIVSNSRTVTDAWGVPRDNLLEITHDVKV